MIREKLNVMANESGKNVQLDAVTHTFHTWLRDQEIQKANDSTFSALTPGKSPRDPKALFFNCGRTEAFQGLYENGCLLSVFQEIK